MTLSVCLIVRNEQDVIGRCLTCVKKFADEIVVVDTGSTDRTQETVRAFTDKIYEYEWQDDFSAARNFSLDKASCEFVMWLDADDVVPDESCEKIKKLKDVLQNYDMAYLPYAAASENGVPTFVYSRERIFRRSCGYRFKGFIHEAVEPSGRIYYSDAVIYHSKIKESDPFRNLKIFQKHIAAGICLDEREKFYYGRELLFNKMYRESAAVLEDFLNGGGWVENKCEACVNLYYAYTATGDSGRAVEALLKSFSYSLPKSNVCCILGDRFFESGDYRTAVFWYLTATNLPDDEKSGAFVNRDYCGFIPYMQLCVIYDKLGDYEQANAYNEKAGLIKPNNKSYLSNAEYFRQRLENRGKNK